MTAAVAVTAADAPVRLPKADTWDEERAAHLLRRAGFGGTPAEVKELADLGLEAAVARLVDFEAIRQTDPAFQPIEGLDRAALRPRLREMTDEERREVVERLQRLDRAQVEELRAWWMRRMVKTPRPFEEKMTLFWHGYLTSGHREVKDSTMLAHQNELLRTKGLGHFRDLLVAISKDPAMLRYLDNASNRKGAPNENYARELLELFTLGVGHYTEKDVQEAARALTGWGLRESEFFFARNRHDYGEKHFLGQTGDFDGADIIDIIVAQPACAEHLARKLLVFFVREDPPDELVQAFAGVIRDRGYDLRASMRELFSSEAFYASEARHVLIKSPVELVVGTFRLLEIEPSDPFAMASAARGMGQELFQPPNVKGWDGGVKWVNSATLFARYNFASAVLAGTTSPDAVRLMNDEMSAFRERRFGRFRRDIAQHRADYPGLEVPPPQVESVPLPPFDPSPMIRAAGPHSADSVLNHAIERVLQMRLDPAQRDALRRLLVDGSERFDAESPTGRQRVVALLNALMCMPEYQVK
jgi:uncharacterized protein (DUF1800 family)